MLCESIRKPKGIYIKDINLPTRHLPLSSVPAQPHSPNPDHRILHNPASIPFRLTNSTSSTKNTTRSISAYRNLSPPDRFVSNVQVVIIPCGIGVKTNEEERKTIYAKVNEIEASLRQKGIHVKADIQDTYSPGWKFNQYKLKVRPLKCLVLTYRTSPFALRSVPGIS